MRRSDVRARRLATKRTFRGGALLLLAVLATACGDERYHDDAVANMVGGNPDRGPLLIRSYGCGTCHTISGVTGANGLVGPPLTGIAERAYIAGVLPNAPENMVRWIENPKAVDSLTAMPVLGVSPADARDIAAYLYTLR
ncbi:MAG TPA: c-type cytochrome [Gemmatimonadaceae bacterium]|nr:c-type cytochrome [Gemmatimonadaceae bacterium]